MKYHSNKNANTDATSGMTLIEMTIYIALVSMLLSGFIQFAYAMHFGDIELIHEIEDAQK